MSELSVNDQLEGILSDFEALKRSFDIEDVESPDSAVSVPVSPSSSHFFLNHDKASEGRRVGQSPSLAFSNNNNNMATTTHHSHIGLGSNPSPVPKSRTLISSLSFNQGSMSKPAIHTHGSSVIRAASFQGKLNPNGYSTWTGQGSDNDSLHSSTSSLEYSGGGGAIPLTKHGLQSSHSAQEVYQRTRSQFPQHLKKDVDLEINPIPRKFYSYGTVFHSEMNEGTGTRSCVQELSAKNNVFLPSLELQFHNGGGGMLSVQNGRGGDRVSSALRCTDATVNLNGHIPNASFFGEEAYCGSKNDCKQQEPRNVKFPQSRTKETPRLNKFPLDLDSLVSTSSNASSIEAQRESIRPQHPKNLSRSTRDSKHQTSPPSTSVSPSASLSSLDSSSDTPPFSLHYPFLPFSSYSPTSLQGPILPETCYSPLAHFTAQIPRQEIPTGPQVVEDNISDAQDSVGSIIQRIASFSQPVITDAIPTVAVSFPEARSRSPTKWNEGMMKQSEIAKELETGLFSSMEYKQDEETCMAEKKQGKDDDNRGQSAVLKTEKFSKDENCFHAQMERGKDKDEGELQKEMQLEADVKVELCPSVPGLQMNFIHGTDLFGYVGIEAVLDQIRNKTMKSGFEFNIMVVGQSGLGKSTLVNTLFKSKVSRKSCTPNYEERIFKTVKLQTISHVIEEKGVKMKLTVIDTPGFGDQINNKDCWEPIVKYINEQYEKYLKEELHVNRKRRIPDTRVHCCIYFLPATGHRLRPIDIEFMKRLGKIVSIVPVIAKADTLTIGERQEFKERIRQDIAANGISVYPQKENDEDPEECILNDRIREKIPFAVVGTDKEHQVNGNKVLGRKTKWGIIEVENVAHCEFANLRDLLIRSHLQDLKDVTHNIHYETYRVRRLNESNVNFSELGLPTWLLENGNADKSEAESHL